MSFTRKNNCRSSESYKITVESTRKEPVKVEVLETLSCSEWKITDSSLPYKVIDDSHILFELSVLAQGKAEVNYTVEYTP